MFEFVFEFLFHFRPPVFSFITIFFIVSNIILQHQYYYNNVIFKFFSCKMLCIIFVKKRYPDFRITNLSEIRIPLFRAIIRQNSVLFMLYLLYARKRLLCLRKSIYLISITQQKIRNMHTLNSFIISPCKLICP